MIMLHGNEKLQVSRFNIRLPCFFLSTLGTEKPRIEYDFTNKSGRDPYAKKWGNFYCNQFSITDPTKGRP